MKVEKNIINDFIQTNCSFKNEYSSNRFLLPKKIAYQTSLLYILADRHFHSGSHQWWNLINGTNVTLGAIPLKNRFHHIRIFNESLQSENPQKQLAVLTILEPFEIYNKGPLSHPVTPEDWKKMGVSQKVIQASDFDPLSQSQIEEAVLFLEEKDKQSIPTYVHCKAGRGRSATAVICFIMKKFQMSAEEAKQKVFESRNQISLNRYQWQAIKTYEDGLIHHSRQKKRDP